jgi:hypothetical protein
MCQQEPFISFAAPLKLTQHYVLRRRSRSFNRLDSVVVNDGYVGICRGDLRPKFEHEFLPLLNLAHQIKKSAAPFDGGLKSHLDGMTRRIHIRI